MLLKTDYQDDILDLTQNANRKFNEVTNQDGSKSFEDVTEYEQEGTPFGANDVNAITKALTDETHGVSFQFGIDGNGDYGYIKDGETEVTPFKSRHTETITPNSRATVDMGLYHKKRYVDLSAVPNVNSGTQTISNVYTSGNGLDLGETNSVRYIKTNGLMKTPTATKSITANGNNQDVCDYAKVDVNVPNSFLSGFQKVAESLYDPGSGQTITETYTASSSGEYLTMAFTYSYDDTTKNNISVSSTGTTRGTIFSSTSGGYRTMFYRIGIYELSAGQTITTSLGATQHGRGRMIFKIK